MKLARTVEVVRCAVRSWKKEGLHVGLVPTMGFLHEGHESLIRAAVAANDRVVVSVFVNPRQFGPDEDLDRYPRDIESDVEMCANAGADLVFAPDVEVMYPEAFATTVSVAGLTAGLCGKSRPGHFDGVCTVVCKLLNIVSPDRAYFGQKDAQQLAVVRRMCRDLHMPVEIVGCPIVREEDGLAKSSRNSYLNEAERISALSLRAALDLAHELYAAGERESAIIIEKMRALMAADPLVRVDYIEIVDQGSLAPLSRLYNSALVAVAAFVGKTRLIDNTLLSGKS
ncbi:pantoate--beta-alanine ligase [Desulfovibrio sp. OttesenSCG-928-M16]|nr:pantoate--beta-alanine ligase [Desulfovibrio sp. OttesenSCG-928-M16]